MLERVTGWSIRHPWAVIIGWVVLLVTVVGLGSRVEVHKTTDADYHVGQAAEADRLTARAGLVDPLTETVHISGTGNATDLGDAERAATEVANRWRAEPSVRSVDEPSVSPIDGTVLVRAELRGTDPMQIDAGPLVDAVQRVAAEHGGLRLGQFGAVSTNARINDQVEADLTRSETTALPLTLVMMIAVFGSLIAAGLPVLVAIMSVAAAGGLAGLLSHLFAQDASVMSMIVLIGMAVGVDYCLFYLKREREERARGAGKVDAVRIAAQTSGHAVVTSGVAVIASLAGLFVMDFAAFDSLALGAVSVVLIAMVSSLTLLPALLVRLGRWTDRLRIPGLGGQLARVERAQHPRGAQIPAERSSLVGRLVAPVVHSPLRALAVGAALVCVLASPALSLRTTSGSVESLPPDSDIVRTFHDLRAAFPAQGTPVEVVAAYPGADATGVMAELRSVSTAATVVGWVPAGKPVARKGIAVMHLATAAEAGSEDLARSVASLRRIADERLSGTHAVGGDAAISVDLSAHLNSRMPWAVLTVLAVTSLMMTVAFRSVVIGLITCALNLASAGAAFGVLAAVFQSDWGAHLLGFTNVGAVRDWVPMFLFSVLVGLSMDYHVFVLSRVREHARSGMPIKQAVVSALSRTGGVITSAALVMVGVFAIFATLSLAEMKQLGVGLAAAIAIDATLVRLILLPAALVLAVPHGWRKPRPSWSSNGRVGPVASPEDPRVETVSRHGRSAPYSTRA